MKYGTDYDVIHEKNPPPISLGIYLSHETHFAYHTHGAKHKNILDFSIIYYLENSK